MNSRIAAVFLVFVVSVSAIAPGIVAADRSASSTPASTARRPVIDVLPGQNVTLPQGQHLIAITTTEDLDSPTIRISLGGAPGASIVSVTARKFDTISTDDRNATLTSDEFFYTNNTVLLRVDLPARSTTDDLDVTIDVDAGGTDTSRTVTYDLTSTPSVQTTEALARQAERRAQIATAYADIYDQIEQDSSSNIRTLARGILHGTLVLGIQVAKGMLGSLIPPAQLYFSVETTYQLWAPQRAGVVSTLTSIFDAIIPNYVDGLKIDQALDAGETGSALRALADLYRQEATAWRNGNRARARRLITKEKKTLCVPGYTSQTYDDLSNKYCLYAEAWNQGEKADGTPVHAYFDAVRDFAISDSEYIQERLRHQARLPAPAVRTGRSRSAIANDITALSVGETTTLNVTVSNSGGISERGYLSISHSKTLNITRVTQVAGEANETPGWTHHAVGDRIIAKGGVRITAQYPLTDIYESYFDGETNSYRITVKRTATGDSWLKYRVALLPFVNNGTQAAYVRAPTSGPLDQQGWHTKYINASVSGGAPATPPTARFTASRTNVAVGQQVTFDASGSIDPDGRITRYEWDFDGDGTVDATTTTPTTTHTFSASGTYRVTLAVVDDTGKRDTTTHRLAVSSSGSAYLLNATFETGLGGWTIGGKYTGSRATIGDGSWSSKYGGSVRLHVDGAPSALSFYKTVGSIPKGARITVRYESSTLQGEPGGPRLVLRSPSGTSTTIDLDKRRTDQNGTLVGRAPRDFPAGTVLNVKNSVWPGAYTIYVTSVRIARPGTGAQSPGLDPTAERISFEEASPGAAKPVDPWYLTNTAGVHEITATANTHGSQSLHLSGASGLGQTRANLDVDLTDVAEVRVDVYPVSNNPSFGDVKVHVDGVNHDIIDATDRPEDQWHTLSGDVSGFTGEHTLVLRTRGEDNEAYFDDIRFYDAAGQRLPLGEVVAGLNTSGSRRTLSVPFTEEFDSGLNGWTIGKRDSSRASRGSGQWSSNYGGSVRLHVDGAPSVIQLFRATDGIPSGTTITVNYRPERFEYVAAGIHLNLVKPDGTRINLDTDNDQSGGDFEQNGTLRGTVQQDFPSGTEIEVKLAIWPGQTTVYVTNITATGGGQRAGFKTLWSTSLPNDKNRIAIGNTDGTGGDEIGVSSFQSFGPSTYGVVDGGNWVWQTRSSAPVQVPAIGDVTGDGAAEIIYKAKVGPNWVRPYTHKGKAVWSGTLGDWPDQAIAVDFDGDGRAEVAAISNNQGYFRVWDHDGSLLWDAHDPTNLEHLKDFRDVLGDDMPEVLTTTPPEDNPDGLQLVRQNGRTGTSVVWRLDEDERIAAAFDQPRRRVIAVLRERGEVRGLDAATGDTHWSVATNLSSVRATLTDVVGDGALDAVLWEGSAVRIVDGTTHDTTALSVAHPVRRVRKYGDQQLAVATTDRVLLLDVDRGVTATRSLTGPVNQLAVGDLDDDGRNEIVVGYDSRLVAYTPRGGANRAPVAAFTHTPSTPTVGETVTFDASGSSDPDGSIARYEWDVDGDGRTDATGPVVTHTYAASGNYTVTLTVADGAGATDRTTTTVPVTAQQLSVSVTQIDRSDFPEIDVYASVRNSSGAPVTGLSERDFAVRENGTTERIDSVTTVGGGGGGDISTALVIDRSGSMGGAKMRDAKAAAKDFVANLGAGDEAEIISFASSTRIDQRWTSDTVALSRAIDSLQASGSTALYDAVDRGISEAAPRTGRSAVIVLTDGKNNAGSIRSVDPVIRAARQANVPVYTIALGSGAEKAPLKDLAAKTGGEFYFAPSSSELTQIYRDISQQISNEYKITYTTHDPDADGTQRRVKVIATSRGRRGAGTGVYTAPVSTPPVAEFDVSVTGDTVSVDATPSGDPDGRIVEYRWDFQNDGQVDATGVTATHTYPSDGTREIRLVVVDDDGVTDVRVRSVTVGGQQDAIAGTTRDIAVPNQQAPAGDVVRVTTTATVNRSANRLTITESFAPAFADVTLRAVRVGGQTVPAAFSVTTNDSVLVALRNVDAGEQVAVEYTVAVPGQASQGDVFRFNGSVDVSNAPPAAITGERTLTVGPRGVPGGGNVSVTRRLGSTTVPAGDTTTVTLELDIKTAMDRLSVTESFAPAFASADLKHVSVNGRAVSPFFTTIQSDSLNVVLNRALAAGDTVRITYAVTPPSGAASGDRFTISGSATTPSGTVSTGQATLEIAAGAGAYAGGDDVVQTSELRTAIQDWVRGTIDTALLRTVIQAWVTGAPV